MIKCQCVHSDTGLCETCFNYEVKLEEAQRALKTAHEIFGSESDKLGARILELTALLEASKGREERLREALTKSRDLHYSVYIPNESEAGTDYRRKMARKGFDICELALAEGKGEVNG